VKIIRLVTLLVLLNITLAASVVSAEDDQGVGFGSPNTAENIIKEDAKVKDALILEKITKPWFDWKKKIQRDRATTR